MCWVRISFLTKGELPWMEFNSAKCLPNCVHRVPKVELVRQSAVAIFLIP